MYIYIYIYTNDIDKHRAGAGLARLSRPKLVELRESAVQLGV